MSRDPSDSPGSSPLAAPLAAPLSTLVGREPLWIEAGESVAEAARRMRDAGAGSILVAASPGDSDAGPGIVTDRDLRSRVLAADRAASTPVGEVASRPLHVVPADAPVFTAHLRMLEAGVHHLAVVRSGEDDGSGEIEIVGVVSSTDLLRHQSEGPFWILHRLERLFEGDPDPDLSAWAGWVERAVRSLAESGVEAARVARIVSNLNDHLTRRLLRRAVEDLGPAPTPWAWIVFGSEGRHEQTLLTDQDNALVFADPVFADPDDAETANEADEYFRALAERMTGDLLAAGFHPCPGGYMATHWCAPLSEGTHWCAPLSEWARRFRGWIEEPEPEALLGASIFFDFRRVDGELDLAPLHEILEGAGEQSLFLHHLFANSQRFRPPLGLFGRLKTDRSGALDLKSGGIAPLVGLARVAGLAAGGRARRTVDRLRAAADEGVLAREDADRLDAIFRFLLDLRLRRQLVDRAAGRETTSAIRPADLPTIERDRLQSALRRLAKLQDAFAERW